MKIRRYKVGRMPVRRARKVAVGLVVLAVIGTGGFFAVDMKRNDAHVNGVSHSAAPSELPAERTVDEPLYSFQLPGDWEEKERISNADIQSITWQSKETTRSLTLYVDRIQPDLAINRLVPVEVKGNVLASREASEPCTGFKYLAQDTKAPSATTWQDIEFICDVPNPTAYTVGTGTLGSINSTAITTPANGKHLYFFRYTDTSAQPDSQILIKAIQSFQAK